MIIVKRITGDGWYYCQCILKTLLFLAGQTLWLFIVSISYFEFCKKGFMKGKISGLQRVNTS